MKLSRMLCITLFMSNTIVLAQERTTFIPDVNRPSIIITPGALTQNNAIETFFCLPHKVLPLTPFKRAEAFKEGNITVTDKNKQLIVSWTKKQNLLFPTTQMKIVGYTTEQLPIVLVKYTWKNPGMIDQNHSYTYQLVRKKNGWDITRTD